MTQSKISTVQLKIVETATWQGKVTILHVMDKNGVRHQFNGSSIDGGYFTELLVSRPDVIAFLAPATAAPLPGYGYHRTRQGLHVPGLHVLCTDKFNEFDWVIAVEEDCGCDPGWKLTKILGRDKEPGDDIVRAVRETLKVSETNSFVRYELGGSVLGQYRF